MWCIYALGRKGPRPGLWRDAPRLSQTHLFGFPLNIVNIKSRGGVRVIPRAMCTAKSEAGPRRQDESELRTQGLSVCWGARYNRPRSTQPYPLYQRHRDVGYDLRGGGLGLQGEIICRPTLHVGTRLEWLSWDRAFTICPSNNCEVLSHSALGQWKNTHVRTMELSVEVDLGRSVCFLAR
jgi:hypothetical protein